MFATRSAVFAFFVLAFLAGAADAQQPTGASLAAPVPTQIFTGQKVFISNAGYDAVSRAAFDRAHEPNRPLTTSMPP
jgi:hypothetical protein